ncbi:MAG TPA: phospho-sugar mutase, partial [Rectinemataceae bacterium]
MDRKAILDRARDYLSRENDAVFSAEVERLIEAQDFSELEDRFYKDLEFGTGGLRGIVGGGYNRMNSYVVMRATQGLCDYINQYYGGAPGLSACVAHDSRRMSKEFAEATASVFAANGIKAYLFPSLRPTPALSFALRKLGCSTGVVVTASHNPPQYNGYKAYWNDGSQVVPPHDTGIIEKVQAVSSVKTMALEEAKDKGLISILGQDMDDAYVAMAKSKLLRPWLFKEAAGKVKLVYTPLHGTGAMLFERILGE